MPRTSLLPPASSRPPGSSRQDSPVARSYDEQVELEYIRNVIFCSVKPDLVRVLSTVYDPHHKKPAD